MVGYLRSTCNLIFQRFWHNVREVYFVVKIAEIGIYNNAPMLVSWVLLSQQI